MKRLLVVCLLLSLTTGLAFASVGHVSPGVAEARGCDTLRYGGDRYVFYKKNVRCRWAKRSAKRVHRTRGAWEPRRYDCESGSNFRTGGHCQHRFRNKFFGWHPGD